MMNSGGGGSSEAEKKKNKKMTKLRRPRPACANTLLNKSGAHALLLDKSVFVIVTAISAKRQYHSHNKSGPS